MLPIGVVAQTPSPVVQGAIATVTGTITAIDYSARIVSVQFPDKTTKTVQVGPDVTRFAALKVGDTVTFIATESVVFSIAKPGTAVPAQTVAAATGTGVKPSGGVSDTVTTIVTVTALDLTIPSITVQSADGGISSFKVKDVRNVAGVKVGDKIQISYNRSLVISVK
jgi:Cu/Ag efflux protein CusF